METATKEQYLSALVDSKMSACHQGAQSMTQAEASTHHSEIKKAKRDLAEYLSKDAVNCLGCEGRPMGMLKRPAIMKDGIVDKAPIYAIYCNTCETHAIGNTPEQAAENWNKQHTVPEDKD